MFLEDKKPHFAICVGFLRPTFNIHWENDVGDIHQIVQGEGGEQGDPLMPCSVALANTLQWQPLRKSCARERNSSRIEMICASFANQTGWEKSMFCCRNICGTALFGMEAVWSRGSRCWGCHRDTQTSSSVSCSGKSMNTRCCSSGSRSSVQGGWLVLSHVCFSQVEFLLEGSQPVHCSEFARNHDDGPEVFSRGRIFAPASWWAWFEERTKDPPCQSTFWQWFSSARELDWTDLVGGQVPGDEGLVGRRAANSIEEHFFTNTVWPILGRQRGRFCPFSMVLATFRLLFLRRFQPLLCLRNCLWPSSQRLWPSQGTLRERGGLGAGGGLSSQWRQARARFGMHDILDRRHLMGLVTPCTFISQLAKAKRLLQRRAEQAWRMRWGAILSCAAAKAVATCLLGLRCAHGSDGDTPLSWEWRRTTTTLGWLRESFRWRHGDRHSSRKKKHGPRSFCCRKDASFSFNPSVKSSYRWQIQGSRPQLAKPNLANTTFGQPYSAEFGQFCLTEFGQTVFGHIFFLGGGGRVGWVGWVVGAPRGRGPNGGGVWAQRGGGPEGWGPNPEKVGARRVGAQNFALFFPPPAAKFVLFFLLWGLLVEFWWWRGAFKCARLEFSGCCVKQWRLRCRRGFTRLSESPNGHIWELRRFKNTTKIPREDPRERRKNEISGGERKKRVKFWVVRRRGRSGGG